MDQPRRIRAGDPQIAAVLTLVQTCFAPMAGRIDPPSSMLRLTEGAIAAQAEKGEVWTLGQPPVACVFLTPKGNRLYIGKLSVHPGQRGKGLARRLIDLAETRARALGLGVLELNVRVELTENHQTFERLGFTIVRAEAHAGFDRPTSYVMQRTVVASA